MTTSPSCCGWTPPRSARARTTRSTRSAPAPADCRPSAAGDLRLAAGPAGARRGGGDPCLHRRLDRRARLGARRCARARATRRRPAARAARRERGDRHAGAGARRGDRRRPRSPRPDRRAARLAPRRRAAHRWRARRHRGRRRARPRPHRRRRQEDRPPARRPGRHHRPRPRLSRRSGRRSTSCRPRTGPSRRPSAIVQILDVSGQPAINAATQGLPTGARRLLTRIWFYDSPRRPGSSAASTRPTTRATSSCRALPKDLNVASYKDVLVTRETERHPTEPGRSTCAGRSRAPPAARPQAAACRGS